MSEIEQKELRVQEIWNVNTVQLGKSSIQYLGVFVSLSWFALLCVQRSRAALQRYLFYCNRYMNHMQSLRFEHKLYAQVKQKMEEMQQHNMSWIEVQFLKKAVDVLCQCRSTLMFTYVFAFYLKKNNQSIIFEVRWVKVLLNAKATNHQNVKSHKSKAHKNQIYLYWYELETHF